MRVRFANWREDHEGESLVDISKSLAQKSGSTPGTAGDKDDYSHIYRSVASFIVKLNGLRFLPLLGLHKINQYIFPSTRLLNFMLNPFPTPNDVINFNVSIFFMMILMIHFCLRST